MRITFAMLLCVSFLCVGCETAHKGAKEVGKPIGGTFKVLGGVTEGAADAYADDEGSNPYNR
jgi:hypothetical protein